MITLQENEHIVYEARKHWIVLAIEIFFIVSLKVLPLFVFALIPFLPIQFQLGGNVAVLFTFLYVCWLSILWVAIFYVWTDYYLDVWVITDRRLIAATQHGLFSREIDSLELQKIQNTSVHIDGVLAHMFNFGAVEIETASETGKCKISGVAKPNELKDTLIGKKGSHSFTA